AATRQGAVALGFGRKAHAADDGADAAALLPAARPQPTLSGKREVSRYVNIQQGCNNYCTFCVVPFTRGREGSRPPADVLADARRLAADGAREITLLGQNVNSYGADIGASFVDVLAAVAAIPTVERVRFTTSNPHDLTPELARLFAAEPKLGRYM